MAARYLVLSTLTSLLVPATYAATETVTLKNAQNKVVGTATLTPLLNGFLFDLKVHDLPPGKHALHFHENGRCLAPKFASAGGHFNPEKRSHGFNATGGEHAGDMANFIVGKGGEAEVEVVNTSVTLASGATSLKKKGGTSLVIHQGVDDYKSQPAGDAGERIACGVIK
jgi:Cu-Zn family superoxide dismutase